MNRKVILVLLAVFAAQLSAGPASGEDAKVFEDTCEQVVADCPGVDIPPNPQCSSDVADTEDWETGFGVWRDYHAKARNSVSCVNWVEEITAKIAARRSSGGHPRGTTPGVGHGTGHSAVSSYAEAGADGVPGTCIVFTATGTATYKGGPNGDGANVTVTYPAAGDSDEICN